MDDLFENFSLYQRLLVSDGQEWYKGSLGRLPAITAYCDECKNSHTFNPISIDDGDPGFFRNNNNQYSEVSHGETHHVIYICKKCNHFTKHFLIRFDIVEKKETDDAEGIYQVYVWLKVNKLAKPEIDAALINTSSG